MTSKQPGKLHYTFSGIKRVTPGEIGHMARHEVTGDYCIPLHDHDYFEVQCGCAGRAVQTLNGRVAHFLENELYILRPEDVHEIHAVPGERFVYYNIAFERTRLQFLCDTYDLEFARQWLTARQWERRFVLSPMELRQVRQLFKEMLLDTRRAFAVDRFLINLFFLFERRQQDPYASCPDWLQDSIGKLGLPRWLQMGPRALEKLSGYSLEHIGRVLKSHAGCLPRDVLNRARMEYAAYALSADIKSISEIIEECGYRNTGYFFRLFKETYKCTPLQYRQHR